MLAASIYQPSSGVSERLLKEVSWKLIEQDIDILLWSLLMYRLTHILHKPQAHIRPDVFSLSLYTLAGSHYSQPALHNGGGRRGTLGFISTENRLYIIVKHLSLLSYRNITHRCLLTPEDIASFFNLSCKIINYFFSTFIPWEFHTTYFDHFHSCS